MRILVISLITTETVGVFALLASFKRIIRRKMCEISGNLREKLASSNLTL